VLWAEGIQNLFSEIIAEKFPNCGKNVEIQEAFKTPNRHDWKRTVPQHIIVQMPKAYDKEY
jgi:hypothetical protein